MTFYIYSPNWFSGIDSILEIITIITSLVISYYSYKTFKLFNIKKYKYLSLSFLLFSIAFITKIISNLIFIIPIKKQIILPYLTISYTTYTKLLFIENISFIFHKITLLLSITILFFIINKEKKIETILLTSTIIIILGALIENFLLFNFIIIIILSYILSISIIKDIKKIKIDKLSQLKQLNKLNKNSKNNKNNKLKYSAISKFLIGLNLSYFILFLSIENNTFYFLGETIQAITFFLVLINIIKIFRK